MNDANVPVDHRERDAASPAPGRALGLLAVLGLAAAVSAQSFLGTIRGTVTDPQGGVVAKATVLITDESTGVPRTVETDAEGRFEATNLRPGSYRVEIVTTNFKKFEQTNVVLRAAGIARVDAKLELGAAHRVGHGLGRGQAATSSSRARPSPWGSNEQQLRDLPRNSRDMQSFLLLNPNVLGGSDNMQFLGGRTYGVSYIQDGQASTNAIFGTRRQLGPRPRRDLRDPGAVELVQRRVRRPRRRRGHDQARRQRLPRHGLLRLQLERAQRAHLQPEVRALRGGPRGAARRPERRHPRAPLGGVLRRPDHPEQDVLLRELRGLERQGHLRRRHRDRPHRGDARRRLLRRELHDQGPADRPAVPGQRDPREPARPVGPEDHGLLLPAAERGDALDRLRPLPPVRARDPQARARGPADRPRAELEGLALPARQLPAPQPERRSPSRRGNALTNLPILDSMLNTAAVDRRLDEDRLAHRRERAARRLQLRQLEAAEQLRGART